MIFLTLHCKRVISKDVHISVSSFLFSWQMNNQNGALACSALKQSYRNILCSGRCETSTHQDPSTSSVTPERNNITFVHLKGTRELIASRMRNRDHFMPISLLDSQFETLEEPSPDEGIRVLTEDITQPVDVAVSNILKFLLSVCDENQ